MYLTPEQEDIAPIVEQFLREFTSIHPDWRHMTLDRKLWAPLFHHIHGFLPVSGPCTEEDPLWDKLIPVGFQILQKLEFDADQLETTLREVA